MALYRRPSRAATFRSGAVAAGCGCRRPRSRCAGTAPSGPRPSPAGASRPTKRSTTGCPKARAGRLGRWRPFVVLPSRSSPHRYGRVPVSVGMNQRYEGAAGVAVAKKGHRRAPRRPDGAAGRCPYGDDGESKRWRRPRLRTRARPGCGRQPRTRWSGRGSPGRWAPRCAESSRTAAFQEENTQNPAPEPGDPGEPMDQGLQPDNAPRGHRTAARGGGRGVFSGPGAAGYGSTPPTPSLPGLLRTR